MNLQTIDTKTLEGVIRSRRALIEFFTKEMNLYFPNSSVFNTKFAMQVFSGEKLLLKLSQQNSPSIPEIKKNDNLLKKRLYEICLSDNDVKKYFPDDCDYKKIPKPFYHSILYHLKRTTWDILYKEFEMKKIENSVNFKDKIKVPIKTEILEKLLNYRSNFNEPKSKQYFQFTKNKEMFSSNVNNVNNIQINENFVNNNSDHNRLEVNNVLFNQLITRIFEYIFENNVNNLCDRFTFINDRQELLNYITMKIYQSYSFNDFSSMDLEHQLNVILSNIN